ncbi:MAG: cell division protein DivIVA [Desulfuromonas sp.]|uniref:DivIVA domain-containing protein n=1 Tax=Desulfuromonas sp. TaxID=892 RepID=UPI000CAE07DE|nr:DivIVA domain-containing protein [Desulfuromonas sp.]PLX84174.1 MAG: cell division protein DivIVA [Desulfuromonas sp.]
MRITPIDIQQYQFKTRPLGYEKASVDHFLELVADELERLFRENQEVKEEFARTRADLEEMRAREATLKETLLTTQKVTDELKVNARKEVELLIEEARLQGEKIVRDADARRIQLIDEIQEIKRQKISFETSLRALVESHVRLLDQGVVSIGGSAKEDYLLEQTLPFEAGNDSPGEKEEGEPGEHQ